jgi:serine acetyltransferase
MTNFMNIFGLCQAVVTEQTVRAGACSFGVPAIAEGATIGCSAELLGPIIIGRDASIEAISLVMTDVADFEVAVGVPAEVERINHSTDLPNYRSFEHNE